MTSYHGHLGNNTSGTAMSTGERLAALQQVVGDLPPLLKNDIVMNQSRAYGDFTSLLLERAPMTAREYVTGLIMDGYESEYKKLLPIRHLRPGDPNSIKWVELNFDPAFAPLVEVEGVAPIFTHEKVERGARAVRRAMGIKIESGFYMTEEGRNEWRMKIQHLAAIALRTTEFDILSTILQTPWARQRHAPELNGPSNLYNLKSTATFRERFNAEVNMFGLVNKSPDSRGFSNLIGMVRTTMGRNSVAPDTIVVPPFVMEFYYGSPDLRNHYSAGNAVAANRQHGEEINTNSGRHSYKFHGMDVVDTFVYRPTEGVAEDAVDLLTVRKQIGEFYRCDISETHRDLKEFRDFKTTDRNLRVFNERQGLLAPIRFTDFISKCLRWEDDGSVGGIGVLSAHHVNVNEDMFKNNGMVADIWLLVDSKYLPHQHVKRVVETIKALYAPKLLDEMEEAIERVKLYVNADDAPDRISSPAGIFVKSADADAWDAARLAQLQKDSNLLMRLIHNKVNELNRVTSSRLPSDDVLSGFSSVVNVIKEDFKIDIDLPDLVGNSDVCQHVGSLQDYVHSLSSDVEKLLTIYFLRMSITRNTMLAMAEADIYVPVNFAIFRPYMQYLVSSIVVMKAGAETGETLVGHQDFQMSCNNMDRTIYASYVYHGKAIVKNDRNISVNPNVFIQGYEKGNDTSYITWSDLSEIETEGGLKESTNSMLVYMLPVTDTINQHTLVDIRGYHPDMDTESGGNAFFFDSKEYYSTLLNISATDVSTPNDSFIDFDEMSFRCNTLCCLGHYEYGRGFKSVNINTGHLGPNTYDGVGLSRTLGRYIPVKQISYNKNATML